MIANSSAYDGQTITVSGTVSSLQSDLKKGRADFERYPLCDNKTSCVNVVDLGRPSLEEGHQTTASGMYRANFQPGNFQATNLLIVKGSPQAH